MIQYEGLSTLEILEGANNYNKWIAENFLSDLKGPVLEIGAGTGNISNFFLNFSPLYLTDIDHGLVTVLKKKFQGEKQIHVTQLDLLGKPKNEFINFFNAVIGINVLEHIADDTKALQYLHTMLKKNGKLCLLIPAKKFAYSRLDKAIGHHRRYEKDELEEKVQAAGFAIEKLYYFNFVGLFSWVLRDKIERSHKIKPYQIALFDKIVPLLKIIEGIMKPPLGVSLIVIARKVDR